MGRYPVAGPLDVMASDEEYASFYERLGREYPETEVVHSEDPRRYQAVLREILPFAAGGRAMLDLGCNDGVFTIPYCRAGGSAHGVDISPSLVDKARAGAEGLDATFEVANAEMYRPRKEFDLVLLSEVLEHVRHPDLVVRTVVAALRPGGHCLLTTPSAGPGLRFSRYLKQIVTAERLTREITINTSNMILGKEYGMGGLRYRHDSYYPTALKRWLEGFGLQTVRLFTATHSDTGRLPKMLKRMEARLDLSRIPLVNLFGANVFVLVRKPGGTDSARDRSARRPGDS